MVGIFTSGGLGLERSSAQLLGGAGQVGAAALGRANDGVYVNAQNGNLFVTGRDEFLVGRGPDAVVSRAYNSLGQAVDENGDNWASIGSQLIAASGPTNVEGSTIDRRGWDGSVVRYTYRAANGAYIAKQDNAAYDTVSHYNGGWYWQDGVSGVREAYSGGLDLRVVQRVDRDYNVVTYGYTGTKISSITTADGNYVALVWNGNNLDRLVTVYTDLQGNGKQLTRVHYGYDALNRLSTVTVDLSPDDNSVADGRRYVTSYSYDGSSRRVASIAQTDGSLLTIGYDGSGRVASFTEAVATGVSRTTTIGYAANMTTITDAQGNATAMSFDAQGQLIRLDEPAAIAGGNPVVTTFDYRPNGDVERVMTFDGAAGVGNANLAISYAAYSYDWKGNLRERVDGALNTTRWTYGEYNQVLSETTYSGTDPDGLGGALPTGAMTTRYAYDGENHLRFAVTPEGRVTEYLYDGSSLTTQASVNGPGQLTATVDYAANLFPVSGIASEVSISEATLAQWRTAQIADKSGIVRTDTAYDFRGNISTVTSWPTVDSNGTGYGDYSRTTHVYDQAGNLLSKLVNDGSQAETFAYDGLGRTLRFTNAKGVGTWTSYIDAQSRTVVTLANGLTQTSNYNLAGELISFVEGRGGSATELQPATSLSNWTYTGLSAAATFTADGVPATKYTVNAGTNWTGIGYVFAAAAGETISATLTLQAASAQTTHHIGLFAENDPWGPANHSSARIISGPGTVSRAADGRWLVSSLSSTESTRIEITRHYVQAATGGAYAYVDHAGGFRAGQALILSAPLIVKSRYDDAGAVPSFYNHQFDINQWGYVGATREAAGTIHGAAASKFTVQQTGQHTGVSTAIAVEAGDSITAAISLMASGAGNSASLNIYGNITHEGYESNALSSGRIVSGPGVLTQRVGGMWDITGLSTTEATRIEITRSFTQSESGGVYLYPELPNGWIAGRGIIAGATSIVRTPGDLSGYKYDSLGRVRIKLDPAGKRSFLFYDKLNRVTGEVAADGAVAEHRYDAAGRAIAAVHYAAKLNATQIASLFDSYGNPTAVEFAAIRPAASADDRWAWTVYDKAGRVIESIDAFGTVTAIQYDGASRVAKTTRYAYPLTYSQGAGILADFKVAPPLAFIQPAWDSSVDRTTRNFYDADGNLIGTLDEDLYLTEFVHDKAGRLVETIRRAATASASYMPTGSFDQLPPGSFADVKASVAAQVNDRRSYIVYDSQSRVHATIDGEGNLARFAYTARGDLAAEERGQKVTPNTLYSYATLPAAWGGQQVIRYYRDGLGQVTSLVQQLTTGNLTSTAAYDSVGNLAASTDARSSTTNRIHDARGRLVREERTLGGGAWAVTRHEYDSRGNVVRTIDPRGAATYNYYDERSRLVLQVDGEGYATETSYDAFGAIASVTRRFNRVTGPLATATRPPITPDAARDATTSFTYDRAGRTVRTTDALGYFETYAYNALGDRVQTIGKSATDAIVAGGARSYSYNRRGLLVLETGQMETRNSAGTLVSTTVDTRFHYNAHGDLVTRIEADNLSERRTTSYSFDRAGRLIETRGDALTVTASDLSLTTTVTPTETITYDARGNIIQTIDATGARSLFWYDQLDRKTHALNAVGTLSTWSHDANGNVIAARVYGDLVTLPASPGGNPPAPVEVSNFRETHFAYDALNRLTSSTVTNVNVGEYDGAVFVTAANVSLTSSTVYDAAGNVIRQIDGRGHSVWSYYDKLGRKVAEVDRENYLTLWIRDAEGNVVAERRYASKITGAFDQNATVEGLQALAGTNLGDRLTSFGYDRDGRRISETRHDVAVATIIDGVMLNATQNVAVTYLYNGLDQVVRKTESTGDYTAYVYDAHGRQISVRSSGFTDFQNLEVNRDADYFYDGLGNLVRSANNGARVTTYSYGAGGRLASTTDAGGFTRSFGYDAAGRVVKQEYHRLRSDNTLSSAEAINSRYDALGRVSLQTIASWTGAGWSFGDSTNIAYNVFGEVATRGVNGGAQERFDYDRAGRVWRSTAGDGVAKVFYHDRAGNQTMEIVSASHDLNTYSQTLAAFLLTNGGANAIGAAPAASATATFTVYDKRGQAVQSRQPYQQVAFHGDGTYAYGQANSARVYNAFGEVVREQNARGHWTDFTYNAMGRLTSRQSPQISVTAENGLATLVRPIEQYHYDVSGRLVATRDANGNLTTRILLSGTGYGGAEASVWKEFHADGGVRETRYDVFGDARFRYDELGRIEALVHDNMGRLINRWTPQRADGTQFGEAYTYDGLGQRIRRTTNATGAAVERTDYDAQGRVTRAEGLGGDVVTTAYAWSGGMDTAGLSVDTGGWVKTTTHASGHVSTESSDLFGRATARTDMGGRSHGYSYDRRGQLVGQTNSAGLSVTHSWLNSGLLAKTEGAGAISRFGYDVAGNRISESHVVNGVGHQIAAVTWDAMNRMITFDDSGAIGAAPAAVTWEYDANGNIRRMSASYRWLDAQGNAAGTPSEQDYWYRYDSMNRVVLSKGGFTGARGSGTIARGYWGTDLAYNAASERVTATRSAALTGYSWAWVWYPGHGPGGYYEYEFPQEGENGSYEYVQSNYMGVRQEHYGYTADGYLTTVTFNESGYTDNGDGTVSNNPNSWSSRLGAEYARDALGRVVNYREYHAGVSGASQERHAIVYDARGLITSEQVSQKRYESYAWNTYATTTTNGYGAGGELLSSHADTARNGSDSAAPDTYTTNAYAWWDGAQLASVTHRPNYGSSSTAYTSTYYRDAAGHLTSVYIGDGRARTVSFVNDAEGRVLSRDEADGNYTNGDPRDLRYWFNGVQIGELSNNDTSNLDYAEGIRRNTYAQGAGAFRHGHVNGIFSADFDQSYDAINGLTYESSAGRHTVADGDTLQGIAQAVWGDASLWWKLAEANGLSGNETLAAGRGLTIPNNVIGGAHNNTSTFRPYDPNAAAGDLSPTNPKMPKKGNKCGAFGVILLVVVAVAIAAIAAPAIIGTTAVAATATTAAVPATGLTAILGGAGAAAGSAAAIGAGVIGGSIAGAAGSIASQGVGLATGIQSKFSWKGVALAGISGGISGGFAGSGILQGSFLAGAARGALSNGLTQGVSIATGLQHKFDWTGVAVGAAVGGVARGLSLPGYGGQLVTGIAGAIAGAATRSVLDGTSFGDNILRALPDVIGATIGDMIADQVKIEFGSASSPPLGGGLAGGVIGAAGMSSLSGFGQWVRSLVTDAADTASDWGEEIVVTGRRIKDDFLREFFSFKDLTHPQLQTTPTPQALYAARQIAAYDRAHPNILARNSARAAASQARIDGAPTREAAAFGKIYAREVALTIAGGVVGRAVAPIISPAIGKVGGWFSAKGAGSSAEIVAKSVPNPYGKLGGPAHRAKVAEMTGSIEARGLRAEGELRILTPNGLKEARFVDVVGYDSAGYAVEFYQIGRQTRAGLPVAREARALNDLEIALKVRPEFIPYN